MDSLVEFIFQLFDGVPKVSTDGRKMARYFKLDDLHEAIKQRRVDEVAALVQEGADVNSIMKQETAFTRAIHSNSFTAADIIMNAESFDPNAANQFDRTPLFMAAKSDQVQFVGALLRKGAKVDAADVDGVTPLGACAWYDRHEAATLLIQHGADINKANRFGETPLHRACSNVGINLVRVLIEHNCDVNVKDRDMKTPLMKALPSSYNVDHRGMKISTSLSICQMLIQAGADLNSQDNYGKTAMRHAVDNSDTYSVCALAGSGCKLDIVAGDGYTPFSKAVSGCNPRHEIARYLLYYGANPNQPVPTSSNDSLTMSPICYLLSNPMQAQSHSQKWSRSKLLLALQSAVYPSESDVPRDIPGVDLDGADPPFQHPDDRDVLEWLQSEEPCALTHQTRLCIRKSLGYENVMVNLPKLPTAPALKPFINLGFDSDSMRLSKLCELHISIEDGLNEKVKEIVASGMDINVYIKEKSALALALEVGNLEATQIILRTKSPETNEVNPVLESALHIVARKGHLPILEEVMSLSRNVNANDADGHTPLRGAILNGHFDIATALIDEGANVSSDIGDDIPFLHLAAAYGVAGFVNLLLDKGADPNSVDKYGNTALHIAATKGADYLRRHVALPGLHNDTIAANFDVVQMMLTDGEPRYIKSSTGHASVIECLLRHGADPKKVDRLNQTALECARKSQSSESARLLELQDLQGRPRT